ncbi:MAG: hypothetical protein V1750_01270, partial [Acidobacteriota bacterium]
MTARARSLLVLLVLIMGRLGVAQDAAPPAPDPPEALAEASEKDGGGAQRLRFWPRVWDDLGALAARPAHLARQDWRNLGLSLAAVGGAYALDDEIRDAVQRNRTARTDDLAEAIRPLGHRLGPLGILGVCWAAGRIWDKPGLVALAEDGFEATLLSVVLITPALKEAAGRAKPVEGLGSGYFEPFSRYQSFPSGEAAQAFTLAAVVAAHTESKWVAGAAWGLAGLIA